MGRERPTEPPRVVPDAQLGRRETPNQRRAREELERLKNTQGPGFFGALAAGFGADLPRVQFVRRGYESGIVDELNDFYARRPRPWRPRANAPKPNRKTMQRSIGRREMHRRQTSNRMIDSSTVYDQPRYRAVPRA